ncbi:minor histocompatibility protein HA-1-like [Sinocyclocheilus rhinocerous]|uniref:minor histocompatibility protein HA-1-like n=1 Tax=Sinocyclocheilus rhinocerous TaxID=307959 RepID=UPI0007B949E8|nr:PREDICTED: minor histocompatibility protein HA-1-like [Sinocyclocheilus rhinocerous]
MFSRKKKEPTNKASSPSKKSNSAQNPSEHSPNDTIDGSCTLAPPDPGPLSCPGTPSSHCKLTVCSPPVGALKRPSGLSRHASAVGFAFHASGTWGFHKGYVRAALTYGHAAEAAETSVIEVEDIPSLLRDVARFAEAVEKLKDMVLGEEKARRLLSTFLMMLLLLLIVVMWYYSEAFDIPLLDFMYTRFLKCDQI